MQLSNLTGQGNWVIENTFGICASRFRLFRIPIIGTVDNVILATKAIVALHNYLVADSKFYFPPSFGDLSIGKTVRPGDWRNDVSCQNSLRNLSKIGSNNYTNDVKAVRANFCRYFSSDVDAVFTIYIKTIAKHFMNNSIN